MGDTGRLSFPRPPRLPHGVAGFVRPPSRLLLIYAVCILQSSQFTSYQHTLEHQPTYYDSSSGCCISYKLNTSTHSFLPVVAERRGTRKSRTRGESEKMKLGRHPK